MVPALFALVLALVAACAPAPVELCPDATFPVPVAGGALGCPGPAAVPGPFGVPPGHTPVD